MLAKEIKIRTIKQQREFIENVIDKTVAKQSDGGCTFRYIGYVYPEVIKHFEEEGFKVEINTSDGVLIQTHGLPLCIFTVRDDITLSDEEQKQAEEYQQPIDNTDDEPDLVDLFKMISGSM